MDGKLRHLSIKDRNEVYVTQLRENPTYAEVLVCNFLDELGADYVFQYGMLYPFHRIYDFYLPSKNIGIEIDGSSHDKKKKADRRKDRIYAQHGIRTFRISNRNVFGGSFKRTIIDILNKPDLKPKRSKKKHERVEAAIPVRGIMQRSVKRQSQKWRKEESALIDALNRLYG